MANRRDPFDPSDPEQLRPEQRIAEVAAILAAGVIRMRENQPVPETGIRLCRKNRSAKSPRRGVPQHMSQIPPESDENCLEF